MTGQLTLDTRNLSKWANAEIQFSRKDAAEVLNKAAGDTALRAVNLVPRANAAAMDKLLKRSANRGIMLKSGRRSRNKKTSFQEFQASAYVYAVINYYRRHGKMPPYAYGIMPKKIARTGSPLTGAAMSAVARQFVNAKKSSIGYIAVGFIMVAKFFGRPVTTKVSPKGWVYHSTGEKATPGNLTAKLMNFARGADKAPGVKQALQTALDSVADDIRVHLTQKMAARAKKAGAVP